MTTTNQPICCDDRSVNQRQGLSTIQLQTFLSSDPFLRRQKTLITVVPRTQLKQTLKLIKREWMPPDNSWLRPLAIIVNTDPASKPGEHWLLIYYAGEENRPYYLTLEFFDSFGRRVKFFHKQIGDFCRELKRYLTSHLRKEGAPNWRKCAVTENRTVLQGLESSTCGHLIVLYCLFRARGFKPQHLIDLVQTTPPGQNDIVVISIVRCSQSCIKYSKPQEKKIRKQFQHDGLPIQFSL